jgi:uncharacterized membrane protein YbhN (UPF0104 family)
LNRLQILLAAVASVAGPVLLWAWLGWVHVTWSEVAQLLQGLNPWLLVLVGLCAACNLVLAAEKWRRVEASLSGRAPLRRQAIVFSAVGTALGQFLPTPFANALIRGGGNHMHFREGGRRGALASVWEQLFDLGVVAVLLPAAIWALSARRAEIYVIAAPLCALAADPLVGLALPRLGRLLRLPPALIGRALCQTLYRISLVRFAVLTLMTAAVVVAMASPIPMSALATSIPPVAASAVVSLLPSGLGVNEWSFLFILGVFGVPGAVVASFALVNRIVVALVSLALGVAGLAFLQVGRPAPAASKTNG